NDLDAGSRHRVPAARLEKVADVRADERQVADADLDVQAELIDELEADAGEEVHDRHHRRLALVRGRAGDVVALAVRGGVVEIADARPRAAHLLRADDVAEEEPDADARPIAYLHR